MTWTGQPDDPGAIDPQLGVHLLQRDVRSVATMLKLIGTIVVIFLPMAVGGAFFVSWQLASVTSAVQSLSVQVRRIEARVDAASAPRPRLPANEETP